MKHSGRALVWYLPVLWWLWKIIECMYKILGKKNFCWVQSPELLVECVELDMFSWLTVITRKVYTLKVDVLNVNLFLVVAHLSHEAFFPQSPRIFPLSLELSLVSCRNFIRKKIWKIVCAPQLQLSECTYAQRSFFSPVYGAWIPHISE